MQPAIESPLLAFGAAFAGAGLGAAAGELARRLGAGPVGLLPSAGCGALLALPAALLLPPPAWPVAAALGTLLLGTAWLDLRAGVVHAALAAPMALLGLLHGLGTGSLPAALVGALLGYLLCLGVEHGFRRLRGRDGLGRGDAWVLGGAGAWVGPGGLGPLLALAAGGTLLVLLLRDRRLDRDAALPFAPALAAAAWLTWIAGGGTARWVLS